MSATRPPAVAVEFSSSCRPDVVRGQTLGEDARADDDRDEEARCRGLGGDRAAERG